MKPNKVCFLFTAFFYLLCSHGIAQTTVGKIWNCQTIPSGLNNLKSLASLVLTNDTTPKVINIFFHIIRRTDGTGGLTNDQVSSWILTLCNDYRQHQIIIHENGRADLNNTTYYNGITDGNYLSLVNTATHSDAIDVYLLSPSDTYSRSIGIPGIACAVGGSFLGTSVLSHELGHCLGLYHTHCGRGCNDFTNCSENTDGSNCLSCGDLICDTPADPCLSGNVDANCNYIGNNSFHPDVHNIMSYAPPTCLTHLTIGQTIRIHSTIISSSIFSTRSFKPYISGPSLICSSGGATFTVNNVPPGCSVVWSSSSNITLPQNKNVNPIVASGSGYGNGSMQATLISPCGNVNLPNMNVWVGPPNTTSISGPSTVKYLVGNSYYAYADYNNGTSFRWWTSPATNTRVYPYPQYNMANIYFDYPGGYTVYAKASNVCGENSAPLGKFVMVTGPGSMSLYPNPASDIVNITIAESQPLSVTDSTTVMSASSLSVASTNDKPTTYNITIANSKGVVCYTTTKYSKTFTIPVQSLPNGNYSFTIVDGVNKYSSQLAVLH